MKLEDLQQGTVMWLHFPMYARDENGDERNINAGLYIFDHIVDQDNMVAVFIYALARFARFYSPLDMRWDIYYIAKPTTTSQIKALSYELQTLIEVQETGELLNWDWRETPHIQYPKEEKC